MITYNNCKFSELNQLEVDDLNFYITTGLLIEPDNWNNPPVIEMSYGKVMELVMMMENEIKLEQMPGILAHVSGMKESVINEKHWYYVFAFYNWILKQVADVEEYLKTLNVIPKPEESAAGIDRFAKFGVFSTIDRLAGGDVLKYDAVEAMPFMVVFTKLQLLKTESEYQEAYQEVMKHKNP